MLKAIVEQAQFSERGAAAYLVDTLMKRRRKIGEVYLEALSPLDYFTIEQGKLCGIDLGIHYRLAAHGVVERLAGDEIVDTVTCPRRGRFCMPLPETDRYGIYRLRVRRGDDTRPVMQVHLKGGPRPRVLGIVRVEP
ncbi:MAG: hypothetical protein JRI68_25630 [Deltaproteobacteria bacterium]|nr:hypothetical protein [Deltaproteobacteria bacterium]